MSEQIRQKTYSIEEVAGLLGIGRNNAYELAKQNRLPVPVIRLGRRIVVARVALDRLLEGGAASAET